LQNAYSGRVFCDLRYALAGSLVVGKSYFLFHQGKKRNIKAGILQRR
jgi:hypothetical protein